ncbi:MAG: PHP domain-containing protein [Clostridia bacterium]
MYKLEMHLHTKGNSSCGKEMPIKIIERYKKAGYDGIVCTNHFNKYIFYKYFRNYKTTEDKVNKYLEAYYELYKYGEKEGIDIFFGVELALLNDDYHNHVRPNCAELLVYGITVEEFKKYNVKLANMNYEKFYNFADENNWLVVQAHPFRARTKLVDPKYLHGQEAYNGHPFHNNRNDLALERAEEFGLIKTAGSDFHALNYEGTGLAFERKVTSEQDLVKLLRTTKPQIFKRKEGNL